MVVVVPQLTRNAGLLDSGTQNIATLLGAPVQPDTRYILTALMAAADIVDPTLAIPFEIWFDGVRIYFITWHGNIPDRDGIVRAPSYGCSPGGDVPVPTTIRLTANQPKRMSLGLDLTSGPVTR
jgi:hypothetical protein